MKIKKDKEAEFRFYEELNDFLPMDKKKKSFIYKFAGSPSIKDAIEACGVPHPEVEIIIINGNSVGFDYLLKNSDRVAVYPVFESLDISPIIKLRDKPLRKTKFIIDVNLGKLAASLRMLGFDALYASVHSDYEIIHLSSRDKRIILTRDQNLLKHKTVTHGYWLRSTDPEKQLREIIKRLDLISDISPFTRCIDCNGLLISVTKKSIVKSIPPQTAKYYSDFFQCRECNKIYWPGSHFLKMKDKIDQLIRDFGDKLN